MYIGEYERKKKLKLIQQDKDKTGLTKVVIALQDQMMENDDKQKWKKENGKMEKDGKGWYISNAKKMFNPLTKVVEVLQDQRSRAPIPSPQQSIMSLGVLTLC